MSIHGILAALLGSSALGGYAPLTLLRAQRYVVIGATPGNTALMNMRLNIPSGVPKHNFMISNAVHNILEGYTGMIPYSLTQMIILGFLGLMPTEVDLHTLIQETEPGGYGYDYGDSYGD